MEKQELSFNMHGYLIRLDLTTHSWSWTRWDYVESSSGNRKVVRRTGGLEFMKMFPTLVDYPGSETRGNAITVTGREEMESTLKKHGVDFVFLYQGEMVDEKGLRTVEEAETINRLDTLPMWELTGYWFSYDHGIQSWAMYDALTGELAFTPSSAEKRLTNRENRGTQAYSRVPVHTGYTKVPRSQSYH